MRVTNKEVRETAKVLDEIIEAYKANAPEQKRDWKTYEQRLADRIRGAIKDLEPLIDEAIATLTILKTENRGRPPELTLKQKTMLLLLKHLVDKSNRDMSMMLVLFSLLSNIDVSYKTVERLYSDEEVLMVLHNLHVLLLKKKGVKDSNCSGDGTGYSVTVTKHYATEAKKQKDKTKEQQTSKAKFMFSFKLLDLESRMYIGHGTSFQSEKDAFNKAVEMATESGITSIRLDRYYSGQNLVKILEHKFGDVSIYLIPKKNATVEGSWKWKRMLHKFVNDTHAFLKEYYQRNQSESGFSEDKRRLGWNIPQRREDRINTADFCTLIWHNLFWLH
jgi:transposase